MTRALALIVTLALAGCSGIGGAALKSAAGAALGVDGGPSVSTDLQAGKSNSRALVGESRVTDVKVAPVMRENAIEVLNQDNRASSDERTVSADRVETVVVNQIPAWLLGSMAALLFLFGAVGWMSPQPRWMRTT